jgi:membrane-associated protease RseP (regulator of RpoE activity)
MNCCIEEERVSILYWLMAIPVLAISILIHEIGHFWAGRWMKVKIDEFGIGFPPRLFSLGVRNGVEYTVNWLPIGGFVRFAGEDDPSVEGGLASKEPWRRAIVLVSGALMNFVLAYALFTGLAMTPHLELDSEQVGVYRVEPGSPGEQGGLLPGDLFLEMNESQVDSLEDIRLETELHRGEEVPLTLKRGDEVVSTAVTPREEEDVPENQGAIGIRLAYYETPVVIQRLYKEEGSPVENSDLGTGDLVVAIDNQSVRDSLDYMGYLDSHFDQEVILWVQESPVGIYYVEPGSPADQAGLLPGDRIVAVNGRRVSSYDDIYVQVLQSTAKAVNLTLERGNQAGTVDITLELPDRDGPGTVPIGLRLAHYEAPVTVQQVLEGTPEAASGLVEGDVILAVDGQPVADTLQYVAYLDARSGESLSLLIEREGERLEGTLTADPAYGSLPVGQEHLYLVYWGDLQPFPLFNTSEYESLPLGVDYAHLITTTYSLAEGLIYGWRDTVEAALLVPQTLGALFRRPAMVSQLSGPVGIVYMGARVAQTGGLYGLIQLMALIGVNLFLVNLFPIPALDGGRLVFVLFEWVTGGKRLPAESEGLIHLIGFFLLLGFVVVVTYFDIVRIATNGLGP